MQANYNLRYSGSDMTMQPKNHHEIIPLDSSLKCNKLIEEYFKRFPEDVDRSSHISLNLAFSQVEFIT
jgi:hypothetical protein